VVTALAELAGTLRVDATTAEVLDAMHAAGVRPVLLKGAAIAARLYPEGERTYVDADLLVAPRRRARAERVLTELGFTHRRRAWESAERIEHDAIWRRDGDPCTIDLHRTLPRVTDVSERALWRALRGHVVTRDLPAPLPPADVLDDAALALMIDLHVAHHRAIDGFVRPELTEDLRRAHDQLGAAAWSGAAALARELRVA
jgi:hypothetical protein